MDNYRMRGNLSAFMTLQSFVILAVATAVNSSYFPLAAFAVMTGNALAIIAHRILFPHRWAD